MILVGIFAEIGACANGTRLFVRGLVGRGGGRGLGLEDLFGESFGGDGREGGNTTLQVVSAATSAQITKEEEGERGIHEEEPRLTASRCACALSATRCS